MEMGNLRLLLFVPAIAGPTVLPRPFQRAELGSRGSRSLWAPFYGARTLGAWSLEASENVGGRCQVSQGRSARWGHSSPLTRTDSMAAGPQADLALHHHHLPSVLPRTRR